VTTCAELVKVRRSIATLDFGRYALLHGEGRRLITGWFDRAWQARISPAKESFEPFIFAWFSVNGWAACVSGVDQDRAYLEALMCDQTMRDDFTRLLSDSQTPFGSNAADFARLWPIFEVKELRRRGIMRFSTGDRDTIVSSYLDAGARRFDPLCWKRHREAGEQVPLDWPHTLAAIYRVRCNLFHGEKAAHSEIDQRVVSSAFGTLLHFFSAAGYLRDG
jgi:hypothetical protein